MVIEENPNANYLAHFKTKGAKNGIRRFQSYAVAPNPSGATGREIGEAAAQRSRVEGHDRRDDDRRYDQHQNGQQYRNDQGRNEAMQRLQERVAPKKKTMVDKLQDKKKKKWAKSYRSLYKHADEFSSRELNEAITRLDLKDKIKNRHLSSLSRNTQDGANTLRNIAQGSSSMLSIYNALALGYNAYNTYKGTSKKYLPTIDTGKIGLGGGGNKDKKKDDKKNGAKQDSLEGLGPYLEHFGVKGQSWFTRHFQSYKTAPTRSGKVGVEVGLAAKQAERNGEEEDNESLKNSKQTSDGRWEKSLSNNSDINFDLDSAERAKTFSKNYEKHRKAIINQIAKDYALKYLNSQDPYWRTRPFKSSVDIGYEIGMAEVKARDGMKNSGMTFSVPSDKKYPIQVTMDPGDLDLYKGHVITFEYDDKHKRLSKSGYSVEG